MGSLFLAKVAALGNLRYATTGKMGGGERDFLSETRTMNKRRERAAGAIGGVIGGIAGAITPQTMSPLDNLLTRAIVGAIVGGMTGVIVCTVVLLLWKNPKEK
jgi:hypothetical protein